MGFQAVTHGCEILSQFSVLFFKVGWWLNQNKDRIWREWEALAWDGQDRRKMRGSLFLKTAPISTQAISIPWQCSD
jgi:hypothetical protein